MVNEHGDDTSGLIAEAFVDTLKTRIDRVKFVDTEVKEYSKVEKKRKKRSVTADSDLSEFLE
jgi:hypothetical protein